MIRLMGVSPLDALRIVELVDEARSDVGVSDFDLVIVKGEENLKKVLREFWTPESSQFYALHIAIERPTIIVRNVPDKELLKSSIYHELAHAKLHGHKRFYKISVPEEILPLGDLAPKVLYLISIAVKDYEASYFLSSIGLAGTQGPLLKVMLEPEDIPWDKLDPKALIIALASKLKPIMFSLPLLGSDAILELIKDVPVPFLRWAIERSSGFGGDTVSNIRYMAREFTSYLSLHSIIPSTAP